MKKTQIDIIAITKSESTPNSFAVILEDLQDKKRISITIGKTEAQALAIVFEKIKPKRPQTHDLFIDTIQVLNGKLKEMVINEVKDNIFHAQLLFSPAGISQSGKEHILDARTSDALALAVRAHCPIYINQDILSKYGFTLEDNGFTKEQTDLYKSYSLNELETMLSETLEKEDYNRATQLRDVINRKKKNS